MSGRIVVHGDAAPRFGPVVDAFRLNFEEGREVGAACAVYCGGRLVVDVWAGTADAGTGAAWRASTIAPVFSVTKGLLAICLHMLRRDGSIDFEAPVARYWPEFAEGGKAHVTVAALLSHRAGLIALDRDLTLEDVASWVPVVAAIEEQQPLWEPGESFGYHALTFGWLAGEVLRRVTGATPGEFFASEVATPLHLDTWIGLPESEQPRVARLEPAPPPDDPALRELLERIMAVESVERSLTLGTAFPLPHVEAAGGGVFNDPEVLAMEVPAANAVSTARSLAKAFAATVSEVEGIRLLDDTGIAEALRVRSEGPNWLGIDSGGRLSSGFMLSSKRRALLSDASFGHDGAGGQLAFADAAAGIGFGYVANQMRSGDDRADRLVRAVGECLATS